jgi:hypothetical protein
VACVSRIEGHGEERQTSIYYQTGEAARLLETQRTILAQDSVPLRQLPHSEWLCGFAAWSINRIQGSVEVDWQAGAIGGCMGFPVEEVASLSSHTGEADHYPVGVQDMLHRHGRTQLGNRLDA